MITLLYALDRVNGAGITLLLLIGCYLLYLGVCFLFPCNRIPAGRKRLLLAPLIPIEICDGLLFLILFPGGEYRNYGVGAAWGSIMLWPVIMVITGWIVTCLNHDDFGDTK